jgi:hypothetical protein
MAPVGHIVHDFVLEVEDDAYEAAVTSLVQTITAAQQVIQTATPDGKVTLYAPAQEVLGLVYNVDHTTGSLYSFLRANIGTTATVSYTSSDGAAVYSGSVTIGPPVATATVNGVETGTCDLTVVGTILTRADPEPVTPPV